MAKALVFCIGLIVSVSSIPLGNSTSKPIPDINNYHPREVRETSEETTTAKSSKTNSTNDGYLEETYIEVLLPGKAPLNSTALDNIFNTTHGSNITSDHPVLYSDGGPLTRIARDTSEESSESNQTAEPHTSIFDRAVRDANDSSEESHETLTAKPVLYASILDRAVRDANDSSEESRHSTGTVQPVLYSGPLDRAVRDTETHREPTRLASQTSGNNLNAPRSGSTVKPVLSSTPRQFAPVSSRSDNIGQSQRTQSNPLGRTARDSTRKDTPKQPGSLTSTGRNNNNQRTKGVQPTTGNVNPNVRPAVSGRPVRDSKGQETQRGNNERNFKEHLPAGRVTTGKPNGRP